MLEYNQVYIIPKYSTVTSRQEVDTSIILDPQHTKTKIPIPVISSNMDTVTDGNFAKHMAKAGAIGAIHRFLSIEENVKQYNLVKDLPNFVSVGVNDSSKDRAKTLYKTGARHFIIDIAHGHHILMKNMLKWFRDTLPDDVFIMAGNVCTREGTKDLIKWGADAIKVGIGGGAVCTTKNVTGVHISQFSAVYECAQAAKTLDENIRVVADGGIKEIGDIAKALGAGADLVMCGRLFAGCPETPMPGVYRGMASLDAMNVVRTEVNMPTPEGQTVSINPDLPVKEVVKLIAGGLRSTFSYCNARNLKEFHSNCEFSVKNNSF